MRKIKILSEKTINRIAAGEVVERPLSVIKELVENAIDANSTSIEIEIQNGGRNLVVVSDNGMGMLPEDLDLAIERHATSKLDEENIEEIKHFGFRGEALPSIASVSRMKITSKHGDKSANHSEAQELYIDGGNKIYTKPAARKNGTTVEVRDLFCYTPTRLKFLKSESAELTACTDLVTRFAIAHPCVGFKFISNNKVIIDVQQEDNAMPFAHKKRLENIMGPEFTENLLPIHLAKGDYQISGFVGLPTYNSNTSLKQFQYVNNRLLKDKLISKMIKVAYSNLIPYDRFPVAVLFFDVPHSTVDVNVHPSKIEIRFRDEAIIKELIIQSIRSAILGPENRTSSHISKQALSMLGQKNSFDTHNLGLQKYTDKPSDSSNEVSSSFSNSNNLAEKVLEKQHSDFNLAYKDLILNSDISSSGDFQNSLLSNVTENLTPVLKPKTTQDNHESFLIEDERCFLGHAKCQIGMTYIIAETSDSLVIVDQHAAHERLVMEDIAPGYKDNEIQKQVLVYPEVIKLSPSSVIALINYAKKLSEIGIVIEKNGTSEVLLREMPVSLSLNDVKEIIRDIADDVQQSGESYALEDKIAKICATVACHSSIRGGKKLSIEEMNALLRKIERTPAAAQCNHGRPSYTKIPITEIAKLFQRK